MKRILAVVLTVLLLVPVSGAMASQLKSILDKTDGPATLQEAVATYLDGLGFTYNYDEENERFDYTVTIDSTLSKCDVRILIDEEGARVYAYSPITPKASDEAQLAATAEYLTRANYGLNLGNFEMDYADGEVRYKTCIRCFDRVPSQTEIEWIVDIPVLMLERYGDGLAKVVLMGADPAEMIDEAEAK